MWDTYAVCECGWKTQAPFGDTFHVHVDVCPACGKDKIYMKIKVMRWVSTAVWWNPFTWSRGHWETRDKS